MVTAGPVIQKDAEGKPQTVTAVTLIVTPEEAEKLTNASSQGQFQLALRNPLDSEEAKTRGIQMSQLIRGSAPLPEAPVARAPRTCSAGHCRPSSPSCRSGYQHRSHQGRPKVNGKVLKFFNQDFRKGISWLLRHIGTSTQHQTTLNWATLFRREQDLDSIRFQGHCQVRISQEEKLS